MKPKKYVTGIRFLRGFDIIRNREVNRLELALFKILKDGPESVHIHVESPKKQWHFSFYPESVTKEQIARALRSLAYKITHD